MLRHSNGARLEDKFSPKTFNSGRLTEATHRTAGTISYVGLHQDATTPRYQDATTPRCHYRLHQNAIDIHQAAIFDSHK